EAGVSGAIFGILLALDRNDDRVGGHAEPLPGVGNREDRLQMTRVVAGGADLDAEALARGIGEEPIAPLRIAQVGDLLFGPAQVVVVVGNPVVDVPVLRLVWRQPGVRD